MLKRLIEELCPYGVEYRKLDDLLDYTQPTKYIVKSTDYDSSFSTPVLTAGASFVLGYTDEIKNIYLASVDKPVIIFDDFTTSFHWVDFKFKVKSSALKILTNKNSSVSLFKFVYYAMQCITYQPSQHGRQWIQTYSQFKIPLPPIPIQEEIVRILDKFTLLKAELEAELEARTVQYHYYRDALLDFSSTSILARPNFLKRLIEIYGEARQIKLGDLIEENLGGGTPSKSKSAYWNGGIPWASVKDLVGQGMYISDTADSISELGLRNSSSNLIPEGWLLICTRINPGVCSITKRPIAINQDLRALLFRDSVSVKFMWYYFQTIRIVGKGTTVKGISVEELERISVLLPPLPVQEAIVEMLDRFEIIVHDLQDGLPGEIALRQKQYEYYRDQLLSFKALKSEEKSDKTEPAIISRSSYDTI